MIKADPEFAAAGTLQTALQGALHIALMPGNDGESERRLGVVRVIAGAVAEYSGWEYVRSIAAHRNSESIIDKIFDERNK